MILKFIAKNFVKIIILIICLYIGITWLVYKYKQKQIERKIEQVLNDTTKRLDIIIR